MEVPGKREMSKFSCKPCEESDLLTRSEGFCTQCEEYMCTSCFDTHRKWKLNRDHTLTDCHETVLQRECSSDFEKCEQHQGEPVKFYCAQHEQIGCGDCMIIGHRSCNVDYIPDLAKEMKVPSKFESVANGTEFCQEKAKHILSSIKNNLIQVDDIYERFKQDVNMFRDEIITLVNNLANRMLEEGECVKAKDNLTMTNLVEDTECLMKDLILISESLESKMKSPSQLFVCSVSKKPKLDHVMEELNEIQGRNKIESYEFKRDRKLCRALATTDQLGKLQKDKEQNSNDQELMIKLQQSLEFAMAEVCVDIPKTEYQPFLDRQLVCRNIKVDGQFLSYMDSSNAGNVGLYVDKDKMVNGSYYEIEILSLGQRGTIAIGLVPDNYPANMQPGWGPNSIAYHADDGHLYHEYGRGKPFGPVCSVGDRIGCGIVYSIRSYSAFSLRTRQTRQREDVFAVFTRNDRKVGEEKLNTEPIFNLYAAVGMHSSGEKVRIILDAEMPVYNMQQN